MLQYLIFWSCCQKSKQTGQILMAFTMSALILIKQMDSHPNNLVISMPTWLTCILCSALFCRDTAIMILLPFLMIPSMTATSFLKEWLYFFYNLSLVPMASRASPRLEAYLYDHLLGVYT